MSSCFSTVVPRLFALVIWLQLVSGLIATTWTAFFNEKVVDISVYFIFIADVAIATFVFYYTVREILTPPQRNEDKSENLQWVASLCSLITGCLLGFLIYYNTVLSHLKFKEMLVILLALEIYITSVVLVVLTTCCYLCKGAPKEPKGRGEYDGVPDEEAIPDQALEQMVNHVKNNPLHKTFTLYAHGPGGGVTPFQVTMH